MSSRIGKGSIFPKVTTDQDHIGWKLFVDGASRNNPGPAGAGIYLLKDGKEFFRTGCYLGKKTNNQAEYLALIIGLSVLEQHYQPDDVVRIISDSQLLVCQVRGEYRVRNLALQPLHAAVCAMMKQYDAHIAHVLRTDNTVADEMANRGIDKRMPIPAAALTILQQHGVQL